MAREKLEEDDDGETRRDEQSQSGVARAGMALVSIHPHRHLHDTGSHHTHTPCLLPSCACGSQVAARTRLLDYMGHMPTPATVSA